jgi:integrase
MPTGKPAVFHSKTGKSRTRVELFEVCLAGGVEMSDRKPFILYKKPTKAGPVWYAKLWSEAEGRYQRTLSTGVIAKGKKERKDEAYEAARALSEQENAVPKPKKAVAATVSRTGPESFLDFCLAFWSPTSAYAEEAALLKKKPLSLSYITNSADCIRLHLKPFEPMEKLTVSELTAGIIKDWMLWAAKRGLSGRRINACLQAMKVPIRYLIKREELDRDPFLHIDKATHTPREKGVLTLAERDRLINLTGTHPQGHLAVLLGLLCGMRMGEIRGLQWGDIAEGIIHIRHNWQDGEGIKAPKCGSFRQVPTVSVVDAAIEAVRGIARSPAPDRLVFERLPYENKAHSGGVLWKENVPYSDNFFVRALEIELTAVGIPGKWHGKGKAPNGYVDRQRERNLTFHGLRHSCFTLARLEGISELETQTLAGWKDARMMANYTNHGAQVIDLAEARKRMEASIGKTG